MTSNLLSICTIPVTNLEKMGSNVKSQLNLKKGQNVLSAEFQPLQSETGYGSVSLIISGGVEQQQPWQTLWNNIYLQCGTAKPGSPNNYIGDVGTTSNVCHLYIRAPK